MYTKTRPLQIRRAVAFYEDAAERLLGVEAVSPTPSFEAGRFGFAMHSNAAKGARSAMESPWWLQRDSNPVYDPR